LCGSEEPACMYFPEVTWSEKAFKGE